jgi:DNA-binding NtrC family response regulator
MPMEERREGRQILTPKVLCMVEQTAGMVDEARLSLTVVHSVLDGLRCLRNQDFDVVLASFPLGDCSSVASLLEEILQTQPTTPVVIQAPLATAATVADLLSCGAFHVLEQGDATSLLYLAANSTRAQEAVSQTKQQEREQWLRFLVGESRSMERIFETIRLVAPRRSTVLITGETGTGKEMVARSIHAGSNRAHLPMVCVNCSALPETLLEAELFGHVKGAFTGAMVQRAGRFEQANHSTIFLDEIGDLPLSIQAKLLRVLQEREFQRLGSSETLRADVRVIAATHADLPELIGQGKFREDLYYRLNVVQIVVPPLRERGADIRILVEHFMDKVCQGEQIVPRDVSRETLDRLAAHDWPGNVRQLENAIEKAIVLSGDRRHLFPGDFPLPARQHPAVIAASAQPFIPVPDQGLDFERTVGSIELNLLEQALKKTGGNKKLAAEMLGLKRTTLAAKLKTLVAVGAA